MMNRYLVEGQSVQTPSVDMDSEQVFLPSTTGPPSSQSRKEDIKDTGDADDQLHL